VNGTTLRGGGQEIFLKTVIVFTTHDLHGATSQKTTFFIVTPVKTSNLTTFFNSPVFNIPRQCPLVLLLEVYLREGKAPGSEKV
jgi:hypothetical protein